MGIISELRHPTTWYSKLVIIISACFFFLLLVAASFSGYLVHKIVSPAQSHSNLDLQNFPGHPQTLAYVSPGKGPRDGWFFPGLKSAPTIILCPGYGSSRGELLTLASALQDHQYNVFLFDFSAQGASAGRSTLGFREVAELRAAVDAVANRGDVDVNRFGLWGLNLGAYVSLSEAINDRRVRAVAAESTYNHPEEMATLFVTRSGLGSLPLITWMTKVEFRWLNAQYRHMPPLTERIGKLPGTAQLYLVSSVEPVLAESTKEIFQVSPAPHELAVLPTGNYAGMLDDEKHTYENRIVSFFLVNLPPVEDGSSAHR